MTHLIGENSVITSRPKVSEPVETSHLEVLERSMGTDVSRFGSEFAEFRSSFVVVRALPRKVRTASTFEEGVDSIGSDRMNGIVIFPSRVGVFETFPFAQVLDCEAKAKESIKIPGTAREGKLTMLVVDVLVGRSFSLRDDTFNLFVRFEFIGFAFPFQMNTFEIFATERRIIESLLLRPEDLLDVVLDTLETFETFEVFMRLPSIVNVTVVLPFDEEDEVALGFIFRIGFYS